MLAALAPVGKPRPRCTLSSWLAVPARPGAAADYLLGARDATGQLREGVEILRGDPHQVAAVADALAFEHKYTSGVIAWAPEDTPTDAQISAVMDAFERTAWVGLEPDRYAWSAVAHRERGGALTCMSSPLGATSRPAGASTSRRRAGRRHSARYATPSTPNTAGAGRMEPGTGPGCSNPGTAPTSRRRGCGPALRSNLPPAN